MVCCLPIFLQKGVLPYYNTIITQDSISTVSKEFKIGNLLRTLLQYVNQTYKLFKLFI